MYYYTYIMDTSSNDIIQNKFLNKKLLIIIFGVFLIVLITIVVVLSLVKKPGQPLITNKILNKIGIVSTPAVLPVPTKPTNLQIAEKTQNWLETLMEQNFLYEVGLSCEGLNNCEKQTVGKQLGVAVLWSRFNLYQKTKKSEDLIMINKQLDVYTKETFQSDFWHCKLLYQMNKSGLFDNQQKEKLKTICQNSTYLRYNKMNMFAYNSKQNVSDFNFNQVINSINNNKPTGLLTLTDLAPKNNDDFLVYITYVSEFVEKYFWFNRPDYLWVAKGYFDHLIPYYIANKKDLNAIVPLMAYASLDLYRATRHNEYLIFTKYLNDIAESDQSETTVKLTRTALLQKELYRITKDKSFLQQAEGNLKKIINKSFDFTGYSGYRIGIGAFHNQGKIIYYYDTVNNTLIVDLITMD